MATSLPRLEALTYMGCSWVGCNPAIKKLHTLFFIHHLSVTYAYSITGKANSLPRLEALTKMGRTWVDCNPFSKKP